jgi:hypothetical protein
MVATEVGVRGVPQASAAPPGAEDARRPGVRGWFLFWPVVVYVAVRGLTLAALGLADLVTHDSFVGQVYRWDGIWFVHAAQSGYPRHLPMTDGHVAGNTIAFFPLYPGLIRWISHLTTVSPLVVAAVISAATGLTAAVGIGLLVRHWAGREPATRATLLFVVFPGTFAFSLMYSEGIAITCLAFGLLALLRKQWWLAGLLGLAATATTPIALAFVLSCAWCAVVAIRRHRDWRSLLAPVLAPLGFVAYMVWLWAHTGQWNAWRLTEKGGWKSYPSLVYPLHIVATFLFDPVRPTKTGQLLFVGTVVTVVGAVLAVRQRQPAPVLLYGLAAAVLAAAAAPVGLRPRFIMLAFPLVVAIGTRFHGRAYAAVVTLSVAGLVLMTWLELFSKAVFP